MTQNKNIEVGLAISANVQGEAEIKKLTETLNQTAQSSDQLGKESQDLSEKLALARAEAARLKQVWDNNKDDEHAKMAYVRQMGVVTRMQKQMGIQTDETSSKVNQLNQTLEQSGHKMTPLASSIGKIGMAAAGAVGGLAALQKGLSDVLVATQEYQAIATRFTYAFGGAEEGAKQLAFVRDEANRLGLEMMGAANGYAQFAAAAKDLNISTEQMQSIFKGVASATATMGLSAEDANGVFLALSQIAGKGKVSMEELRGQLGERLAPAMSIAAQAMGVTTAELEKMVENGLAAETFLPRFGAALEQAFGADAATNVESLSGQINLLKNSYNEFLIKLGEGGVGQATIVVLKDIGAALETAQKKFDEFMQSEDGLLLQQSLSEFWALLKQIGTTIVDVFNIARDNFSDFAGIFSNSNREIGVMQSLLMGVNLTVAALSDGLKAVGIVFNLFSGSAKILMSSLLNFASKMSFGSLSREFKQASLEMRAEADKNFQAAHESAMNFESQIGKTIDKMAQNSSEVQKVYDNANAAAKTSIDETAKAEVKAQALSQAYKDAQTAISGFGLDMRAAMNEPTPAIAEMLGNLDKLALGFDDLKNQGVNAGLLIQQAIGKMIDSAANQADMEAVKAQIQSLGEAGKLSGAELENALLAADVKMAEIAQATDPVAAAFRAMGVESRTATELQLRQAEAALRTIEQSGNATESALNQARNKVLELKNALDPTAQAFDRLGIKTKEALAQAATQQMSDFERVRQSGQATQADLQRAFQQTAQAALASGDVSAMAWVQSHAAAYQYKVVVDETGKANLQAAAQTVQAAQTQVAAHNQVATAATQSAQAQSQVSSETQKTNQALVSQGKALSELGQKVHYSLKQTGGYARLGTALWSDTIRHWQDFHINVHKTINGLNQETERGGDIAQWLSKATMIASGNVKVLDKTTLNNLHQAIDKARQKMAQLAEEAKNAREEAEKDYLSAQGRDDEVQRLEQQKKIRELRQRQEAAKKMGHSSASADYEAAITASQRAFEERRRREAEQRERERLEAEQREVERQREQIQRETSTALPMPNVHVETNVNQLADLISAQNQQVAKQSAQQALQQFEQQLRDAIAMQN